MSKFETGMHYGYDGGLVAEILSRSPKFVTAWTPEYGTRRYRVTDPDGDGVERIHIDGSAISAEREVGPYWTEDAERTLSDWSRDWYLGDEPSAEVVHRIREIAWSESYNLAQVYVTSDDVKRAIQRVRPLLPYLA